MKMLINKLKKEDEIEMELENSIIINANPSFKAMDYRELNERIHQAMELGYKRIILNNVCGQRFIGASLQGDLELIINGVPGNDLGIFMDGPKIIVNGNCEDQAGNTMNNGKLIINGSGGDVIGLSSRGGKIYVKNDVGYRVGIHVKEYDSKFPVIIIGGTAKDYLGEYMAGGIIIVLGLKISDDGIIEESVNPTCGNELGAGMHRGKIFIRTNINLEQNLGIGARQCECSKQELNDIKPFLEEFCFQFNVPLKMIFKKEFKVIKPISSRPFSKNYCSQLI